MDSLPMLVQKWALADFFSLSFSISFPSLSQYTDVTESWKNVKNLPLIIVLLPHPLFLRNQLSVNCDSFQKMSSHVYSFISIVL